MEHRSLKALALQRLEETHAAERAEHPAEHPEIEAVPQARKPLILCGTRGTRQENQGFARSEPSEHWPPDRVAEWWQTGDGAHVVLPILSRALGCEVILAGDLAEVPEDEPRPVYRGRELALLLTVTPSPAALRLLHDVKTTQGVELAEALLAAQETDPS